MNVIVVANWKMNPATMRDAKALFDVSRKAAEKSRGVSLVVAPPSIFLRELAARYRGGRVSFAIQHAQYEQKGAYTGELSLLQAKDARAKYALVGHAERRSKGETDDDVRKKVAAALELKLVPIVCVGESHRSADGAHFELVREQLRIGLQDVPASKLPQVLVTYEPLWTIGGNATMAPRDMHEMGIFMRKCVVATHGEAGRSLKILYGGSVDEKNIAAMHSEGDVSGFLVGRASLDGAKLAALLSAVAV